MTKDYAKRKKTNYQAGHSSPSWSENKAIKSKPFIWLSLGIVLGGLITFGLMSQWQNIPLINKAQAPIQADNQSAPVQSIATKEQTSEAGPRFDFYTLLPNLNVDIEEPSNPVMPSETKAKPAVTVSKPTPAKPSSITSASEQVSPPKRQASTEKTDAYIIQIASFRKEEQAESLKATLALSGYETHIQSIVMHDSETWYRLYLGPFTNRLSAQKTKAKLESEQKMNSLIMKINV